MQLPLLFLESMGMGSIILIVVIVLLLFGGKKIPELMRGLGQGVGEFKKGINEDPKQPTNNNDKEIDKK